jgi:L-histidine N-alpha-methyltransferase
MKSPANVLIHASQFPENVRRDLLESLRTRRVNHKFHYDNVKQTQKWLALHQEYSPSRNDADCQAIYEQSFAAAAKKIKARRVHVLGLGCGGGQKDTRLMKLLKARGKKVFYTPCDVSLAMVLVARRTALAVLPEENCLPFVCDMASANDLPAVFNKQNSLNGARLVTFFGMIPNFEPQIILPKLASLIRPKDFLLFSANLAPGKDYADGMKKILPQYDNAPTRDWLLTFLLDLGVEKNNGELRFEIENVQTPGLHRIAIHFHFKCARQIEIENEMFNFKAGETIRLFFSYRYTPARVCAILGRHELEVCGRWIAKSEEEGVFLCRRK